MGARDLVIRRSEPEDVYGLAVDMRPEDRAEILASAGHSPLRSLLTAYHVSTECWTVLLAGQVAAMFGIAPLDVLNGEAAVWMLTGAAVDRHPLAFLRASRGEVRKLAAKWSGLVNAIDARYLKALRWARWVGSHVDPKPIAFGVAQLPFHLIRLEA